MEYNQFSDIKGIFKNFFHKKEDFNNETEVIGLISKEEAATRSIVMNVVLTCYYVIIAGLFGILPTYVDSGVSVGQAWLLSLLVFIFIGMIALGQYGYYYYLNGEKEITDFINKLTAPWKASVLLSILLVFGIFIYRQNIKLKSMAESIRKYWYVIVGILLILMGGVWGLDAWLGFTGIDSVYSLIIAIFIWLLIVAVLYYIQLRRNVKTGTKGEPTQDTGLDTRPDNSERGVAASSETPAPEVRPPTVFDKG
jgi:hypothetical protein